MVMSATGYSLGVDIGGTGIKGGLVDLETGELVGTRFRIDTPQPATPEAVAVAVGQVVGHFDYRGTVGVDFPGVVRHGVVSTAANVDKSWIGASMAEWIDPHLPGPGAYLNDADAAALAEARYGAGRFEEGLIVVVTFGTGIGTGLVHRGHLVPNAELGHIEINGHDAETRASASARERGNLSWKRWSRRASRYLQTLENLLSPDLFILGGGISKSPEKWVPRLEVTTRIEVAQLVNNAGIVGAALAAQEQANELAAAS